MLGFLKKRLYREDSPAGAQDDERLDALYEEFCRTFQHKPGVNFMNFLRQEDVTALIDWLRPNGACALPAGFIRLAVDSTRKGYRVWEQPGINMMYEGRWDHGGLPLRESLDALSVLAQVLEKPIKLTYTQTEGGDVLQIEFEP